MKRKRKIYKTYEQLISNYYGVPKKRFMSRNLVLSKSYDNGEIIVQEIPKERKNEYFIQNSIEEVPFEEYVVTEVKPASTTPAEYKIYMEPSKEPQNKADKSLDDSEKLALLDKIGNEGKASAADNNAEQPVTEAQSTGNITTDNEDFTKDIASILKGEKIYDPYNKQTVDKSNVPSSLPPQQNKSEDLSLPRVENKQAIFDQIARSMQFAEAYDLGSVKLDKMFSDFDKIYDLQHSPPAEKKDDEKIIQQKNSGTTTEEFLRDLDEISRKNKRQEEKTGESRSEETKENHDESTEVNECAEKPEESVPIAYTKSVTGVLGNGVITDPFYRNADEKKRLTQRTSGRDKHLGIDVSLSNAKGEGISDPRRGLPVYAAVKTSIPLADLNMVRTADGVGMGLKGSGDAALLNALVLVQPWSDGGNAYGGVLGLACRFEYTDDKSTKQKLTLYIEFLHLITSKFPPKDGSGKIIPLKDWVEAHPGKLDFGPLMKNNSTLKPSEFDPANLPLVGYLGATEFPHVHIQAAFATGEHNYLKNVRFDPEVMIS